MARFLLRIYFFVYPHSVVLLYKGLIVPLEVEERERERKKWHFIGVYFGNKMIKSKRKKINEDDDDNRNKSY
jgi:hypothetical protein